MTASPEAEPGQNGRETLILSRGDVQSLMGAADYLRAVETGFRAAAEGRAHAPSPMSIGGHHGTFHAKGASLRLDRLFVALKFNGNFPSNPARLGLPTIQGAILLCDGETGSLLAVIDSIEVTLRRTAAATALAARYLARPQSRTILICGCGEQGAAQLAALRDVLPLSSGYAWDADVRRAEAFAHAASGSGIAMQAIDDLAAAARDSDVIVTSTPSHAPFLDASLVEAGTFIAAVGADSPEKNEVDPALMAKALVVADVLDQCAHIGELHHAIRSGSMVSGDVHAELAELVAGTKPGRTGEDEITLFDSTGTALQDVASAALIYQRAMEDPPRRSVDLGKA